MARPVEKVNNIIHRSALALTRKGPFYVVKVAFGATARYFASLFPYAYHKLLSQNRTFIFNGKNHQYFCHPYHETWKNVRAVEIPVSYEFFKDNFGKRILEFGNVLSYYFPISHDVLDKYELRPNVINEDVVDFKTDKKYDCIISISTLEHVGFDELPKDPEKTARAFENLKSCLAPGGVMMFTLPIGYNPNLDRLRAEGKIKFTEEYYLKRISQHDWVQASWDEVKDCKSDEPFVDGNGLIIGVFKNDRT